MCAYIHISEITFIYTGVFKYASAHARAYIHPYKSMVYLCVNKYLCVHAFNPCVWLNITSTVTNSAKCKIGDMCIYDFHVCVMHIYIDICKYIYTYTYMDTYVVHIYIHAPTYADIYTHVCLRV